MPGMLEPDGVGDLRDVASALFQELRRPLQPHLSNESAGRELRQPLEPPVQLPPAQPDFVGQHLDAERAVTQMLLDHLPDVFEKDRIRRGDLDVGGFPPGLYASAG